MRNLTPGATYLASVGWAAPNEPDAFGRKLGLDPSGGADPTSANVIWGATHYGPGRFGNYSTPGDPNLDVRAVARSDTLTIFFFVDHNYSTGANMIFVDAISLVLRRQSAGRAALSPIPASSGLAESRPKAVAATNTPAPTVTPTPTVSATPTGTPTATPTPTPTASPSATPSATATPTATRPPRATATPTIAPTGLSAIARARRPLLLPVGFTALVGSVGLGGLLRRRRPPSQ
ncbi:hypothetical protein [Candidatus Amarobacter glycogenicus]|uniref:hypothetical protein n=1 Tax=Candidatus Amarobacter glycogenicus TaxID=3140699 RepID=UPI0031349E1F|nr:hypothetical protein [Dehalococcoidia bacterium]